MTPTTAQSLTVTVALALATSGAVPASAGRAAAPPVVTPASVESRYGAALRAHVLHTVDGRALSLASLSGEVVVINFWASWCRPCRRELPGLDALNKDLARSGGRVVAISIDEDRENARRFVQEHGLSLPVYHDGPNGIARQLDLGSIPTTLVIDRGGRIVDVRSGGDAAGLAEVSALAKRLLASRTAAAAPIEGGNP